MQQVDLYEKKSQLFNLDLVKITDINATFVLIFPSLGKQQPGELGYIAL